MGEIADMYSEFNDDPDIDEAVCKYCGDTIFFNRVPSGRYVPFNIDDTPHDCLDPFKLMKEFKCK